MISVSSLAITASGSLELIVHMIHNLTIISQFTRSLRPLALPVEMVVDIAWMSPLNQGPRCALSLRSVTCIHR